MTKGNQTPERRKPRKTLSPVLTHSNRDSARISRPQVSQLVLDGSPRKALRGSQRDPVTPEGCGYPAGCRVSAGVTLTSQRWGIRGPDLPHLPAPACPSSRLYDQIAGNERQGQNLKSSRRKATCCVEGKPCRMVSDVRADGRCRRSGRGAHGGSETQPEARRHLLRRARTSGECEVVDPEGAIRVTYVSKTQILSALTSVGMRTSQTPPD